MTFSASPKLRSSNGAEAYLDVPAARGCEMENILTVDLEDWYQGIELMPHKWSRCENRLERSVQLLLEMLDEKKTRATFFVLGYVAEKFPRLVRNIAELGHEIGTHGYGHGFAYRLTPAQFASDPKAFN